MVFKGYSAKNKIAKGRNSKLNLVQLLTLSCDSSCLSVIVRMPSFEKH